MTDLTAIAASLNLLLTTYGLTRDQISDLLGGAPDGGPAGNGLYPVTIPSGAVILVPSPRKIAQSAVDVSSIVADGSLLLLVEDRSYDRAEDLLANIAPAAGKWGLVYGDPDLGKHGFWVKSGAAGTAGWTLIVPLSLDRAIADFGAGGVQILRPYLDQVVELAAQVAADANAFQAIFTDDEGLFGDDRRYVCDGYGCVSEREDAAGTLHLLAVNVATQTSDPGSTAIVDDGGLFGVDVDYDCDEYGCVFERRTADGGLHVISVTAQVLAARPEEARSDGVVRYARGGWTMIPVYGESTSVGLPTDVGAQISTSQPYSNMTGEFGPATAPGGMGTLRPLYENKAEYTATLTETPCSGFINMLSEYAFKHYGVTPSDMPIITGSFGLGGQTVAQLAKGGSSGHYDDWLMPALANVSGQAVAAAKPFVIPAFLFLCGANDGGAGTSYATMKAGLLKLAADVDADVRALTGQTQPCIMLLYQTSGCFTRDSIRPILQAQFDAIRASPLIEYAGNWQDGEFIDAVHQTKRGTFRTALKHGVLGAQYLFEGRVRGAVPIAAWSENGAVHVRFDCPVVIDFDNMGAVTDYGIAITDAAGVVPFGPLKVAADVVSIPLARALNGAASFELARTYQAAGTTAGGCATNIRAAYVDQFRWRGVTYPVFRWGAHASLPIITTEH